MNGRFIIAFVGIVFALSVSSNVARADKISTLDFYELPNSAKMSQVIAAVGEPASKSNPTGNDPLIEWSYPNITDHETGKPFNVRVFFDRKTERLNSFLAPHVGIVNKK